MTVLRAVETRRSVVRSANTGISAFITPLGEISKQSEIFVPWAEKEQVTLLSEQTVWVQYGYKFGPLCFFTALFALLGAGVLSRGRSPKD